MTFSKYPKLTAQQKATLPGGIVTAQEKLDGANAGIELRVESSGVAFLIVHSRNVALAEIVIDGGSVLRKPLQEEMGGFGKLVELVESRATDILQIFTEFGIEHVYGEWLTPHTLQYAKEHYGHFYPFDVVRHGRFQAVSGPIRARFATLGWRQVPEVTRAWAGTMLIQADVEELLERVQAEAVKAGRPRIEGIVLKWYDKDTAGELDQFGQRFCYKHVLQDFREDHAANHMFPAPKAPLTTEQRLVDTLSDRSIEKVYQKVVTSNGHWENKLIPQLLGRVWQEFLEEHLGPALAKEKMPVVNTRELKAMLDKRAREFALTYVQPAA